MKQLTKRDVVIDFKKHYFDNPENLASDGEGCVMIDSSGRKCAFARWVVDDHESLLEDNDAGLNIALYSRDILMEEVRHIADIYFWSELQISHDALSEYYYRLNNDVSVDRIKNPDMVLSDLCEFIGQNALYHHLITGEV